MSADTPACVRPDHLFLGTHAANAADREAKGRRIQRCGEQVRKAKLTDALVREARRMFALGGLTKSEMARRFSVSETTMRCVLSGERWKHVPLEVKL